MARGVNKVILVGNLGNDPETKYTQGGMAICTLSLATTSTRKDKDGQKRYYTDIVCDEMQMLGGRGEGGGQRSGGGERPQRTSARPQEGGRQESAPRGNAPAPASRDFGDDFADDDIPF